MTRNVRALILAALLTALIPVAAGAQTLAWDASPDADVTGYVVAYGTSSGTYTNTVNVGNVTSYALPRLDTSLTYFFAVRAYTSGGTFSDYSSEVSLPAAAPANTTAINSFTSSSNYPLLVGQTTTWTAVGSTSGGAVEYSFWLFTEGAGWREIQPYGPSGTLAWTPGWLDRGNHAIQVWARAAGSSARYEAWVGTPLFAVNTLPLQLSADAEFPIPPGQPVNFTATFSGGAVATPLEYRFWVHNSATGAWTVFQDYGTATRATWTPSVKATYSFQVWARRVGSTAAYETYASYGPTVVSTGPVTVTSFAPDRECPCDTGDTVTWTARATGGTAGPLQYAFWRFRAGAGWTKVQDYSASKTYSWTPLYGDEGQYAIQVWVRSAGSTAAYEAWAPYGFFKIKQAPLTVTTGAILPAAPLTPIQWTADVPGSAGSVEYSFWLYTQSTGTWVNVQPYSTTKTFTWTPSASGTYALQVWSRRIGNATRYDDWKSTPYIEISNTPAEMVSLTPGTPLPATMGTPVTWTALARGGTRAPLLYQYWAYNAATGWVMVRDWAATNTFTWTPTLATQHALQVWVKSTGSTAKYESWAGTGFFEVK